jgi:ABC-type Zn2+ transport system substrate-binding protein/surface adhesin
MNDCDEDSYESDYDYSDDDFCHLSKINANPLALLVDPTDVWLLAEDIELFESLVITDAVDTIFPMQMIMMRMMILMEIVDDDNGDNYDDNNNDDTDGDGHDDEEDHHHHHHHQQQQQLCNFPINYQ